MPVPSPGSPGGHAPVAAPRLERGGIGDGGAWGLRTEPRGCVQGVQGAPGCCAAPRAARMRFSVCKISCQPPRWCPRAAQPPLHTPGQLSQGIICSWPDPDPSTPPSRGCGEGAAAAGPCGVSPAWGRRRRLLLGHLQLPHLGLTAAVPAPPAPGGRGDAQGTAWTWC